MSVSLNAALSGLRAAQQALNTISTNIANASTPGYTRKILPQETQIVDGKGAGVSMQSLVRNVDKSLVRDINKQASITGAVTVEQKYLQRIQDFHGASEAERSISAQIGKLADSFSALSSSPNSSLYLNDTLNVAQNVVTKFNEFSNLINQMRNDTETEINQMIEKVNNLLEKIAKYNNEISLLSSGNRSIADYEDLRDNAMKELSQYLQISSFTNQDNQMVVQTKQGQILADGIPHKLLFNKSNLTPTSYLGAGANGIYLDSFTTVPLAAENLGGSLGALLDMRDDALPAYQAQIDEMAQKLAYRFDSQGLRLFVDTAGNVPPNADYPNPVAYVGFASAIRVNPAIVNDPTLLRSGTYGATVLEGSNEIISKISAYAFGAFEYQQASGTANISAGTIFSSTGLTQYNRVIGNTNISAYTPDLDAAPNITAPASFTLTIGATPYPITVTPGMTATGLVSAINAAVGSTVASLNGVGALVLQAPANISIADTGIGPLGLADLGLEATTYPATNPAFTVQVGSQASVTINITAATTGADLLLQLNAIPGLSATLNGSGQLVMRPTHGGSLTVENLSGAPLASLGVTVANVAHVAFRQSNLGPSGTTLTGLIGNSSLEDYARSLVSDHAEAHNTATDILEKEQSFLETLSNRLSNESGVDIDEELSNLIRIQTAYTAAARMIAKTEELFNEMMQTFR